MTEKTIKLTLKSDLQELNRIEAFVKDVEASAELSEEVGGNIMLLLSEAVTNGIIHGNKQNPDKNVVVEAKVKEHVVEILVTDQGDGFDPEDIPNPLAEENLLKTGGRGVYLMKEFADEVWYNDKGNQLKLTFARR
jgi:serine/threonine-protein kinase RsbW